LNFPFTDHILDFRFITQDPSTTSSSSISALPSTKVSADLQVTKKEESPEPALNTDAETDVTPSVNPPVNRTTQPLTVCLNVSQDGNPSQMVSPVVTGKLDPPFNKKKDSIRIITQNCRGAFHTSKKHTDFYIPSMESLQGYSPDVVCLCETNTDWKIRDNGYDVALVNRAIWNPSPTKTVLALRKWKNLRNTTYQPGGVLTACMNAMSSRIKSTFRDPYGRFTKIIYQAKGKRNVSLYNIYMPNPGSTSTSGIDTVWMQQWRCLRDMNDPCDPRDLCISHLKAEI